MSLLQYCLNKDEQAALALLSVNEGRECDIYEIDKENKSNALMWTCYYNLETVALKILDVYLALNAAEYMGYTNKYSKTVLNYACLMHTSSVAMQIIDLFADYCNPGQVDNHEETALLQACAYKSNHMNVAIALINRFGKLCRPEQICDNLTALMYLCVTPVCAPIAIKMIDRFGELCQPYHVHYNKNKCPVNAFKLACDNMPNVAIKLLRTFGPKVVHTVSDSTNQICNDICDNRHNVALHNTQCNLLIELLVVFPQLIRKNGEMLLHLLLRNYKNGQMLSQFQYNIISQKCILTLFDNNLFNINAENAKIIKQCIKDALSDKAAVDSKISELCSAVNVPRTNKRLRGFQTVMAIEELQRIICEFCYNPVGPFHFHTGLL